MESALPDPDEGSSGVTPPSLGSCLVNVIASPGEVFEGLRPAPPRASRWLAPGLLLVLVGWIGAALVMSQPAIQQQISEIQEKAFQQQVDKGKIPREQVEQARAMAQKVGGIAAQVGAYGWPVVAGFGIPFVWGLVLWLIGAGLLRGECSYLRAVEVAGLVNMIGVLGVILRTLLVLVTGNVFADANAGLLLPGFDPTRPLHGALAALNLITFWSLTVEGFGIAKVSGVSVGKAIGLNYGLWLLKTGLLIGFGLAMQSLANR